MVQSLMQQWKWSQRVVLALALVVAVVMAGAASAQDSGAAPEGSATHIKDRESHVVAGFGLEMAYPFGGGAGDLLDIGSGANFHAGYELDHGMLVSLFEVVASYLYFPSALHAVREEDVDLKRIQLGVAVGYDLPLVEEQALIFEAFVRLGAGFLTASTVASGGQSDTGFCFETGVTIDYQVVEQLGVGVSGGYGQVQAQYRGVDNVHWALTELHFSVGF